jgi:biopolymer transport protein ExbD
MELPHYWACTAGPAAHGMRAQLLLAFLLSAVLLPFLLTIPRATHKLQLDFGRQVPTKATRFHRLEITPDGKIRFDGEQVDTIGLRMRLDMITASTDDWIDFRPDPRARYELFVEVLAVAKRARIERLRLDSKAFAGSIDE